MIFFDIFFLYLIFHSIHATIDLNLAELQYLADHLTAAECRRLVAAAHFHSYDPPNALDQAERKVPKDLSCLEHLLHWNSGQGEGRGETHGLLTNRLRQLGKVQLADWLSRTAFHQLGVDLQKGVEEELVETSTEIITEFARGSVSPTIEDPTSYNTLDYFMYSLMTGLIVATFAMCIKLAWDSIREKQRRKSAKYNVYDSGSDTSDESDEFDVRTHIRK